MKYDDVRGACLGLIKSRLHGAAGRPTQAAALGWQLENGDVPVSELAALCAAWVADPNGAPHIQLPLRWRPSPLLRAFFAEYKKVCDGTVDKSPKRTTTAPRPRSHAADRRTAGFGSH